MGNAVVHFEIATLDIERAKTFYETVFGSSFTYMEMGDDKMYMFEYDEKGYGAAGALIQSERQRPSMEGTMVYIGCEDLDASIARVEPAGGEIIVPKTSLGEHGFFAFIKDTEGNQVGMHSDS